MFRIVLLLTAGLATGYLLGNSCPAPPPCSCSVFFGKIDSVLCEGKGLKTIPVFINTFATVNSDWEINLYNNTISAIPDNAFMNLRAFSNGQNISIILGLNTLTAQSIDLLVFNGIENMLYFLDLTYNKLSSLPHALGKLTFLKELRLIGNPIHSFDARILIPTSNTLTKLSMSFENNQHWPINLRYLKNLLSVRAFFVDSQTNLPTNSFLDIPTSLKRLSFDMSNFTTIHSAVCGLRGLDYFSVEHNFAAHTLIMSCPTPMLSVQTMHFFDSVLQTFPYFVFKNFPNLRVLYIDFTQIGFIDDSLIPNNTKMLQLSLMDSNFTTIPTAVNKFSNLSYCTFFGNKIRTIANYTIANLQNLSFIELNSNPIVFIAKFAFWNLPNLQGVSLMQTTLTTIPSFLELYPNLITVYLRDSPVICDCASPKISTKLAAKITGSCSIGSSNNTVDISYFIKVIFPICP